MNPNKMLNKAIDDLQALESAIGIERNIALNDACDVVRRMVKDGNLADKLFAKFQSMKKPC